MITREILNSHPISTLRKEVSKYNKEVAVRGYSKMKKSEVVELMMKHQDKFKHIKMNEKAPRKKAEKKEAPKKAVKKPRKLVVKSNPIKTLSEKVLKIVKQYDKLAFDDNDEQTESIKFVLKHQKLIREYDEKVNSNPNDFLGLVSVGGTPGDNLSFSSMKRLLKQQTKKEAPKKEEPKKEETTLKKLKTLDAQYERKVRELNKQVLPLKELKKKFKTGQEALNYLSSIATKYNNVEKDLGVKINNIGRQRLLPAREFNDNILGKLTSSQTIVSALKRRAKSVREQFKK